MSARKQMFWPFLVQTSLKGPAIFLSGFSLNIDFQTTVPEAIGKSFKSGTVFFNCPRP
jgi:hypothetical protein